MEVVPKKRYLSHPNHLVVLLLIIFIFGCAHSGVKQIDWDLTYHSMLDKNSAEDKWLWEWLGHYTTGERNPEDYCSPISKMLMEWNKGHIVSSFLIEGPAFHAGEHHSLWAVETKDTILLYSIIEDSFDTVCEKLTREKYYMLLSTLVDWEQGPVQLHKEFYWSTGSYPGYFAFVSVYAQGRTRQIKIPYDEYMDEKFIRILKELYASLCY